MGQMLIPALLMAAGTGAQAINTKRTADKADATAAQGIRNQAAKQRAGDQRINEEVTGLEASRSADERASKLDGFMDTLRKGRASIEGGLAPVIGSDAFRTDAADAAQGINADAARTAGLLARMDAPTDQRRGEAFGYGKLGTDIDMLARESQGQRFIDELRMRAVRRNPWLDILGSAATAAGGSMAGSAMGGSSDLIGASTLGGATAGDGTGGLGRFFTGGRPGGI